jgi:hypothetical protein
VGARSKDDPCRYWTFFLNSPTGQRGGNGPTCDPGSAADSAEAVPSQLLLACSDHQLSLGRDCGQLNSMHNMPECPEFSSTNSVFSGLVVMTQHV